jgi:hypothetical protein
MSAFSNWDVYNVISEHVIEVLQADTEFAALGSLEIATWDAEPRETAAEYNDHELPAISVDVVHSGQEINPLSKMTSSTYSVVVITTTGGQADLTTVKQLAKRIAARVERVLRQQNRANKQLSDVTADLEGANTDSLRLTNVATLTDGGVINNVLRGAAATTCDITIDFTTPID